MAASAIAVTGSVTVPTITGTAPVAVAQESNSPSNQASEVGGAASRAMPGVDGAIDADAIASGVITNATQLSATGAASQTISGRAMVATPHGGAQLTATYDGFPAFKGTVYAQWIDRDGTVSPIYRATTHDLPGAAGSGGPGMYAFKLPVFKDANGKEHKFNASGQRYRIWAEPMVNERGNRLVQLRNAGGYTPFAFASAGTEGLGETSLAGANMQRTGIWMYEEPGDYMKADEVQYQDPSRGEFFDTDVIRGQFWLETGNERQTITAATSLNDPQPGGYKIFASFLSPEGQAAMQQLKQSFRGPEERANETKKLLTENPQYIEQTVSTTTNEEGKYALQLNEGAFSRPGRVDSSLYMWVEDQNGNVLPTYSSYTGPLFNSPDANTQWAGANSPTYGAVAKQWRSVNFVAVPTRLQTLEITNFNNTDKPAGPGDTAKLVLKGNLGLLENRIEWRDSQGQVVKKCEAISSNTDLKGCESFTVPEDASPGDVYTAVLVSGAQDVAADSFVVSDGQRASYEPAYEDLSVPEGQGGEVTPTFTDSEGADVDAPDGTEFTVEDESGLPEGVTVDKTTGTITVDADTPKGDYTVPVTVTYPDGTTDQATATISVTDPVEQPNWDDATTEGPDKPVELPNNGGEVPDGATVETEGNGDAELNEDGSITVTPNEDAEPGETVTVTVKDGDGETIDTVTVTVTVGEESATPGGSSGLDPYGKCVATGLGVGLPLLMLIPLGLATQINLPGVQQWQNQLSKQLEEANTRLQQQAGVFNPELARLVQDVNATFQRRDIQAAAGGVALVLAGLSIVGITLSACSDREGAPKGSSGLQLGKHVNPGAKSDGPGTGGTGEGSSENTGKEDTGEAGAGQDSGTSGTSEETDPGSEASPEKEGPEGTPTDDTEMTDQDGPGAGDGLGQEQ